MSTREVARFCECQAVEQGAGLSQTMTSHRQHLIEQLRQEEASEDIEHVIDWLADAWATLDMLTERFGETKARQLYTAQDESQQGVSYADLT